MCFHVFNAEVTQDCQSQAANKDVELGGDAEEAARGEGDDEAAGTPEASGTEGGFSVVYEEHAVQS